MTHTQLLIDSLCNPKKLANYRVLSVGKVLQYTFLLITLVTVFSFGQFVTNIEQEIVQTSEFASYLVGIEWLIYPFGFALLFIITTSIQFLKISLYALAGWLLLKPMSRRGEYRHVWRTASFAITWATLLSVMFTMLQLPSTFGTIIGLFTTILFTIIAINHYPKLKPYY